MPVGAAIGAGSLGAGVLGYMGSKQAAAQQAKGLQQALAMFQPYAQMGQGALTSLSQLYGLGGGNPMSSAALSQFRNTPGYQFTMDQGLKATDFADSARGTLLNSNNLKGRTDYASGLADRTFMGSYVNPLLSLAGIGAGGASGAAGALTGAANAQAGGTAGAYNALGGALNSGMNNYVLWNMLGNKSAYGNGGGALSSGQFRDLWNSVPSTGVWPT